MPFLQVFSSLAGRAGGEGTFHNSLMNGRLVRFGGGLQLDTSSPNSSPVSQAGIQGCQVLQALHRAVDLKGELKLFSDPSWAADGQNDGLLPWCSCFHSQPNCSPVRTALSLTSDW